MRKGIGAVIHPNVVFQGDYSIGNYSVMGESDSERKIVIGKNIRVGSYCLLYSGSTIDDDVEIDDYCAIYSDAVIGKRVKLLYGKKIYSKSKIGNDCIIAGNVSERMLIADRVTFMGEVAHSHYNPKSDWDTTDEASPEIGAGSIVGVNALLIGGIKIGCDCYVSAGEILRHDLPDHSVFLKNQVYKIIDFKGLLQTRY